MVIEIPSVKEMMQPRTTKRVWPNLYRLLVDHTGADAYHEWWMTGEKVYRDTLGRRGGQHAWNVLWCNDPSCPARALVYVPSLIENQVPLVTV